MVTVMSDIAQTIGRVRRAMPRNADVMAICDELDNRLSRDAMRDRDRGVVHRPPHPMEKESFAAPTKPKLTRAEIQKNYRLRKKAAGLKRPRGEANA